MYYLDNQEFLWVPMIVFGLDDKLPQLTKSHPIQKFALDIMV